MEKTEQREKTGGGGEKKSQEGRTEGEWKEECVI